MTRWLGWALLVATVLATGYLAALNPGTVALVVAPGRVVDVPLAVVLTAAIAAGALAVGALEAAAAVRRLATHVRTRREARRQARRAVRTERARDLVWAGEYDRARNELARDEPDASRAELLAESMLRAGDAAGARALLSDAVGQLGDELRLLPLLAEAAERSGDLPAAVEAIERAVAARPESPRLLRRLRDLYARAGRFRDALAVAERLVVRVRAPALLEPELQTLRALRYEVAVAQPDARRAARALLTLAREDPSFVPAWVSAGDRLAEAGRRLRARRAWERGAAHRPNPVLLERLEAHDAADGRPARTTRVYRKLVRRHPDDPTLRLLFARHLLRVHAPAEADGVLGAADSPAAHALRAERARQQGDFERAASEFAGALAPGFGLTLGWRCTACAHDEPAWRARCTHCSRWNTLAPASSGLISTTS